MPLPPDLDLDQEDFDLLMEFATKYAMMVHDGTMDAVSRLLHDHAADMSKTARQRLARHIIEIGPYHEPDREFWNRTLVHLQPRSVAT